MFSCNNRNYIRNKVRNEIMIMVKKHYKWNYEKKMIKLISYYHYKVVKTFEMGECYLRICLLLSFINRFLNKFKIFCY